MVAQLAFRNSHFIVSCRGVVTDLPIFMAWLHVDRHDFDLGVLGPYDPFKLLGDVMRLLYAVASVKGAAHANPNIPFFLLDRYPCHVLYLRECPDQLFYRMGDPLLAQADALRPAGMAIGRLDMGSDKRDALVQGLDPILQTCGDGMRLVQREVPVQFEMKIHFHVLTRVVVELGHVYVMDGLDLVKVGRLRPDPVDQVGRLDAEGLGIHHDHGVVHSFS